MLNQCPHCGIRLDLPGSIRSASRGTAQYRLTDSGRLEQTAYREGRRGGYYCNGCNSRLNKYIKEVKVGVV